ncbi:hypothetical protein ACIQVK_19805 [Streptomyces sp. NPDC090493]|uniref:hypothetical protein n=1 Tax=Streptomyces sp. NPDC090493 TaxID=3365964 RepID=UPI0038187470
MKTLLSAPPPGPLPPPARTAAALPCDLLGIIPVPLAELRAAAQTGISPAFLTAFFPQATETTALSRSAPYYRPGQHLTAIPALASALKNLDKHAPGELAALRYALVENLYNLLTAGAFALWESLTDQPAQAPPGATRLLDDLLDAATHLAADLAGRAPADPVQLPPTDLLAGLSRWRVFRELDSQQKIADELSYLISHVIDPQPQIRTILVPLYGSLALALAARAVLPVLRPHRQLSVHLVRLGFHDQARVSYLTPAGGVDHAATAPERQREALAAAAASTTVLVVDDNVGYGSTLRAARTLVHQLGGHAVTRSVETAWQLYHRSGRHDVSGVADLPSLRPNLHYTIQNRLISHLLRADPAAYIRDPVHRVPGRLSQQMAASYDLAVSTGSWSSGQLAAMRTELAHATACWRSPAVPTAPHRAAA